MEQKTYRIAPYKKEYWQWLWGAVCITFFCWCLSDYIWFDMAGWVCGVIFALSCLLLGLLRIRQRSVELFLSDDGSVSVTAAGRRSL